MSTSHSNEDLQRVEDVHQRLRAYANGMSLLNCFYTLMDR